MRLDILKLDQRLYARAGVLKREILKALDHVKAHPNTPAAGQLEDLWTSLAGGEGLGPDQAVVTDGQVITVAGGTVTLTVSDGVVTATYAAD